MACKIMKGIVALLLTLTSLASLLGVYRTHFLPVGLTFGTPEGSFALLAFVVSVVLWLKIVCKLCPCGGKKGMCCCGPSGSGMCPGCGKEPCECKA